MLCSVCEDTLYAESYNAETKQFDRKECPFINDPVHQSGLVLHMGWEGKKFVLLITDSTGQVLHRISLNKDEAWRASSMVAKRARGPVSFPNHMQLEA